MIRFCFTLFLSICIFLNAFAQAPTPDEKTRTYLDQYRTVWIKVMLENKPELLSIYYSEQARLMPEFQKTILGRENNLNYFRAYLNRIKIIDCSRKELELMDLGSMVLEIGVFTQKIRFRDSVNPYTIEGKYFDVWEKTNNGVRLITQAWNYDFPLAFEDSLRFKGLKDYDAALAPQSPINNPISFELAALNKLMESVVAGHDPLLWSQFYTDDGLFCYSRNRPMFKGKGRLDSFLVQHCKEIPIFENLAIRNDRIEAPGPDYVIEWASHIAVWRAGNYSGVGVGKDLRIWRREKNGCLKIYRHIGMYD